MEYFKTQSRALEQFLFAHRVYFDRQEMSEDGMNVWVYKRDAYLNHLLEEWKIVMNRERMVVSKTSSFDSTKHFKRNASW